MLITAALAGALLITGCAQADPENTVTPSANPSDSTPPSLPQPSPSTVPGSPDKGKGEVTLTGTVKIIGVEGGCKALRVDSNNKVYEIKGGDPAVLKEGNRVTIRGKIRTDLMTICQIGPVLEVMSAQPAD